ncbi:Metallo-dependent phosphatase, partial [Massarina eburnea CBS 473.64]
MPLSPTNLFHPTPPTPIQRFLHNPILFLATYIYTHQPPAHRPPPPDPSGPAPIKVVCISDTHNTTPPIPPGDILIHAGDLTHDGAGADLSAQLSWLRSQPHAHKIVIAGNHDLLLDAAWASKASSTKRRVEEEEELSNDDNNDTTSNTPPVPALDWTELTYLAHNSTTITIQNREIKIFGSPYTPKYGTWAFQYPPPSAREIWHHAIPPDTDIVVTHGPMKGHLDTSGASAAGCADLGREIGRVRPRLAVCGHIHAGRGREEVWWDAVQDAYDG